jgi:Tol biopolymer transport system component/tRNA A-37 threonylcarbamoyl transferase component Bud32
MLDLTGHELGPYRILNEIGRGGMANVYLAEQPSVGRKVAVKVLPSHFLQDQTFLKRFTREVEVIARLQHPHILPIYDFGEQDGMPYIVMAYLTGGTLADRIRESGAGLPPDEAARLLDQVAGALDFAHQKGIIHRDFKPSNVLLDEDGNAYLADFGIARVTEETAQLTGSGVIGTPAYMAPEMSKAGGVTPLIDIYALGVTLYQMLTGRLPYEADTPMGVLMAHMAEPVPNALDLRPDLPPGAQTVIERAMSKEPGQRYPDARTMAAALRAALAGEPVAEIEPATLPEPYTIGLEEAEMPPPPAQTAVAPPTPRRAKPERAGPRPWLWLAGGGALLALIGCVAIAAMLATGALGNIGILRPGGASRTPISPQAAEADEREAPVEEATPVEEAEAVEASAPTPTVTTRPEATSALTIEHTDALHAVAISPDGKMIAAGGRDKIVSLWDAETGELIRTLEGENKSVLDLAFSPDGFFLVVALDEPRVFIWDANTGQLAKQTIKGIDGTHTGNVYGVDWSPDGAKLVTVSGDKRVILWDAGTGAPIETLSGHESPIYGVDWSPDGSKIATSSNDGVVIVWDAKTGEALHTLAAHDEYLHGVAWSPDGSTLATAGGDHNVLLWDSAGMEAGSPRVLLADHEESFESVAWSPNGRLLACGEYSSHNVILLDVETGEVLQVLEGHRSSVYGVDWSPDGSKLVSAGGKVVAVWAVSPPQAPGVEEGAEAAEAPEMPTPGAAGPEVIYEDDFEAAGDLPNDATNYYINGQYELKRTVWSGIGYEVYGALLPGVTADAFVAEFDAQLVSNAEFAAVGFTFGMQPDEPYFNVLVNGEGELLVQRWVALGETGGDTTHLIDWEAKPAINKGYAPNHLKLVVDGEQAVIYANDELVGSVELAGYAGGQFGPSAMAYATPELDNYGEVEITARVDNLVVTTYVPESGAGGQGPTGTVSGRMCYPGSYIPSMTIFAENVETGEIYQMSHSGTPQYTFEGLPPGTYYFYAFKDGDDHPGAYTPFAPCGTGETSDCPDDHSLIPVAVEPGGIVTGIDICDWYIPPDEAPSDPRKR